MALAPSIILWMCGLTPLDRDEFPRFRFVALPAKRYPKRLKYFAPRFSKVSLHPFYSITPPPPHSEMLKLIFCISLISIFVNYA